MNAENNNLKTNNLIWTVAENYNFLPNTSIFSFLKKDNKISNNYKYALIGYANKYYLLEEVYNYIQLLDTSNLEDINKIFELIIENTLWDELILNRPGVLDYRNKYIDISLTKYYKHKPKNIMEELDYAFYLKKKGKTPKLTNIYYNLLNDILNLKPKDTKTLIDEGLKIANKYFHVNKSLKNKSNFKKIEKKIDNYTKDKSIPKIQMSKTTNKSLEKDEIHSAEFRQNFFDKDENEHKTENNNTINLSHNDRKSENSYNLVQSIYGKSIISKAQKDNLENIISTDIHEGVKILMTDGHYGDSLNEQFREKQLQEHKDFNKKHYDKNILIYHRSITKLKDIIRNNILIDLEESKNISNTGIFVPSLIWKSLYLNNDNVFIKELKDDFGSIAVDILLDSSASQIDRQQLVAAQGYVIATALTELNVPVRVMSFNNFSNYQIIKLFRDYNDDKRKNDKIFEYTASGSNRDGYAIKLISHMMSLTKYDNKVLIVLSDGKPNNKVQLKMIDSSDSDVLDYIDDIAIKDSSKQVFNSRNKGNYILGVFTGNDEDLPKEKKIYGQDFAYIKDINRFSEIVGYFLKQVLINM